MPGEVAVLWGRERGLCFTTLSVSSLLSSVFQLRTLSLYLLLFFFPSQRVCIDWLTYLHTLLIINCLRKMKFKVWMFVGMWTEQPNKHTRPSVLFQKVRPTPKFMAAHCQGNDTHNDIPTSLLHFNLSCDWMGYAHITDWLQHFLCFPVYRARAVYRHQIFFSVWVDVWRGVYWIRMNNCTFKASLLKIFNDLSTDHDP